MPPETDPKAKKNPPQPSWESRVEALEQQLHKRDAELEALKSQATALQVTVDAYKAKEAERAEVEKETYLAGLQRKATETHQSPIPVEDLQKVRSAYERGDVATAKDLGKAFLERSRAVGAASSAAGDLQDFSADTGLSPNAESGRKRLLEAAGYELDDMPKRRARSRGPRWGQKAGR